MKSKDSVARVAKTTKTRGGTTLGPKSQNSPASIMKPGKGPFMTEKMPGSVVKSLNQQAKANLKDPDFRKATNAKRLMRVSASGFNGSMKTNSPSKSGVSQTTKPSKVKNPRANAVAKAQAANKMKAVGKKINTSPTSGFNRRGKK